MIDGIETKAVLADRAYDSDAILEVVRAKKAETVIPQIRQDQPQTNWLLHKERHKSTSCSVT